MVTNSKSQKIDVKISDIMVSIAPAAIRTMIGVTSSLGTIQVNKRKSLDSLMFIFYFRQLQKMN